jgi:uncharacterized protein
MSWRRIPLTCLVLATPTAVMAQEPPPAIDWDKKARECRVGAVADGPKALNGLGVCLYLGRGTPEDPVLAAGLFKKAAAKGDPNAMSNLGSCYALGRGVARDPARAITLFREAATLGVPAAMVELGHAYRRGSGVAKAETDSREWYRKAADAGSPFACYLIASGAEAPEERFNWYRKAVEAKNSDDTVDFSANEALVLDALTDLANSYRDGKGTPKDGQKAVELYTKAAMGGSRRAKGELGIVYMLGLGVAKDGAKAATWFEQAAKDGDGRSMCRLGVMYWKGRGVATDLKQALTWFRKATASDAPKDQSLAKRAIALILKDNPDLR